MGQYLALGSSREPRKSEYAFPMLCYSCTSLIQLAFGLMSGVGPELPYAAVSCTADDSIVACLLATFEYLPLYWLLLPRFRKVLGWRCLAKS